MFTDSQEHLNRAVNVIDPATDVEIRQVVEPVDQSEMDELLEKPDESEANKEVDDADLQRCLQNLRSVDKEPSRPRGNTLWRLRGGGRTRGNRDKK